MWWNCVCEPLLALMQCKISSWMCVTVDIKLLGAHKTCESTQRAKSYTQYTHTPRVCTRKIKSIHGREIERTKRHTKRSSSKITRSLYSHYMHINICLSSVGKRCSLAHGLPLLLLLCDLNDDTKRMSVCVCVCVNIWVRSFCSTFCCVIFSMHVCMCVCVWMTNTRRITLIL